jgi:hypothetical protein
MNNKRKKKENTRESVKQLRMGKRSRKFSGGVFQ